MGNSDWTFNVAFLKAERRADHPLAERVITAYLDHTGEMIEFMEAATRQVVGRSIPQVMLLHANPLNARSLGRLLIQIADRGYQFIRLDQARIRIFLPQRARRTRRRGISSPFLNGDYFGTSPQQFLDSRIKFPQLGRTAPWHRDRCLLVGPEGLKRRSR